MMGRLWVVGRTEMSLQSDYFSEVIKSGEWLVRSMGKESQNISVNKKSSLFKIRLLNLKGDIDYFNRGKNPVGPTASEKGSCSK